MVVADEQRDHGRLRAAGLEAEGLELPLHVVRVVPELLPALGLVLDDFDRGFDGRGRRRRDRGREELRAGVVPSDLTDKIAADPEGFLAWVLRP